MTVIASVTDGTTVWMAGESEVSSDDDRRMIVHPKVWVRDGLVWGMCGASRPGDLVRYSLRTPKRPRSRELGAYVVLELVPALRDLLRADGCEAEWGALLGVRGELWQIDSDGYSAERGTEGYDATGANAAPALVGLSLTGHLSPRVRLTRVVSAVCRHVPGCGGKISVVHG